VVPHDYLMREYTAKEEGYVFMYVSNENATLVDVYFDDIVMTHTKSNVIQYNEYYPFGLQTANSWTRENTTGNNFLGNGGTELNATTSVYDLHYRNYDPVLGRMNQVDPLASKYASYTPYNFSFNDPVYWNDPNGAEPTSDGWKRIQESRNYDMERHYYNTHGVIGDDDMYGSMFARYGPGNSLNEMYYSQMQSDAEKAKNGSAQDLAAYASTYGSELYWGYGQMPHLQTGEEFNGNIYLYLYDAVSGNSSTSLYSQAPSIYNMAPDSWAPVYGDFQRAKYWAGHGDWSRVALYGASAALDVAGIAGIARAIGKVGARLLVREATQLHHSYPKFLGGPPAQNLTKMTVSQHKMLHKDLNSFLRNIMDDAGSHMRPQRGNSGARIQLNFSPEHRLGAMRDFYSGPGSKYSKAASDFFTQFGRN
ncbi:MAG: hypothetical protein JNL53_05730, partial [Cyclobacteriaceae bacterium]|nr:hypothetical protein [Cyclobacteriaceae bacterium]